MSTQPARRCIRCDSELVMPDIPMVDRFGDMGHFTDTMKVDIHRDPQAWFFKQTSSSNILADICGKCGHIEMRVADPRALWNAYVESIRR